MIKAQFETITPNDRASFVVNSFALEKFTAPYHFHPEYELTWIKAGTGTRFVGKNMQAYGPGDLVFLGTGLPHCWKSEDFAAGKLGSQSIVIQFENAFLGKEFFEKPELESIAGLIKKGRIRYSLPGRDGKERYDADGSGEPGRKQVQPDVAPAGDPGYPGRVHRVCPFG